MNAPEKVRQYDRAAQTVGNIVHLEHFNVVIPDQRLLVRSGQHVDLVTTTAEGSAGGQRRL